ncbi:MAG TPA: hypothetical protein VK567_05900 [Bradyrhizobium sp.]|jgi:hypothetical protein|nr:hypothetical protein [Bradyrhizobium sp.]
MIDRAGAGDKRRDIPEAVLCIEYDRSKAFTCDRFGDEGRSDHAPGAVHRFTRAQAPGEGESGHVSRFS